MNALAHVVRAELFKAFRKRRTYLLAALQWLLLPLLALIVGRILETNVAGTFIDEADTVRTLVQTLASPFGIARVALVGPAFVTPTFYIIAIALFAALLIGEEKSQNMWKTMLVAQPHRLAVLAGKFVVAMILYGLLLAGAFLSGLLFGAIGTLFLDTTFAGDYGSLLALYGLQWLFGATAVLFAFLLVFMVRNVALGLVLTFFLPALVEGLYTFYKTAVGFQPLNRLNALFQALRLRSTLEALPRYFFTNNLYAPARQPTKDIVTALGGVPDGPEADLGPLSNLLGLDITLPHAALVMAAYAVVFGALLTWLFLRHDVD